MLEWNFQNAKQCFHKHKDNWERLCVDILGFNHPLMHVDYVEPLIERFASDEVILALKGEHGEDGMVFLNKKGNGIWESFVPNTGPFCFALIKNFNEDFVNSSIQSLMQKLPGFSVMVCFNKLDPDYLGVKIDCREKHIEKIEYIDTISIPIERSFEEYWERRSKNLKRSIIKKKNRIEKNSIKMECKELINDADIYSGIETYGRLERLGWKGKINTAVSFENPSGYFYLDMLTRFAKRKNALIFQLLFDGKVVASALTIKGGGMMIILKIAYDETMEEYSPGLMMMYELHKNAFETSDIKIIEHYGKATQTAKQLAVNIRTLYHVNFFRNRYIHGLVNGMRAIRSLR